MIPLLSRLASRLASRCAILSAALVTSLSPCLAASPTPTRESQPDPRSLRVVTWNLEWFPSRNSKVKLDPEAETRIIQQTALKLQSLNPDIAILEEIRDEATARALASCLGPKFAVAICTRFLQGNSPGWQQIAIISRLEIEGAWAERWGALGKIDPARGFAFAELRHNGKRIATYGLHLKSNLVRDGDPLTFQLNLLKRELAIRQLLEHLRNLERDTGKFDDVLIAGDFNTNTDQPEFASEGTLRWLQSSGFSSGFENQPAKFRATWKGSSKLKPSTLDYVFSRSARSPALVVNLPQTGSDHSPVLRIITP